MAYPDSDYPGGIDSFPDPDTTLDGTPLHSELHLSHNDAIEKIQTELGINPAGSFATVAARLDHVIRRRTTRPSQAFANGATTQTMTTALTELENVGGITFTAGSGGGFRVPVAATYAVLFSLATGDAIPTTAHLVIVAGIDSARVTRLPGTGNSNQACTWVGFIPTGTDIQFNVSNQSAAGFSSVPYIEICRVGP